MKLDPHVGKTTVPGIAPSAMGPPSLPGYVAVSVTLLDGVPFGERNRDFYKVVRDSEPVADIGGSIRGTGSSGRGGEECGKRLDSSASH